MADHYYLLRPTFGCGGQYAECDFMYKIVDPGIVDDYLIAVQLVEALDDGGAASWLTKLTNCISAGAFVSTLRARRIKPAGGNTAVSILQDSDFPGGFAGGISTGQIAACINWIPGGAGGDQGRNFLPGISNEALVGSRWEDPMVAACDAFISKHLTGFTVAAGIFLPVIFDRVAGTGVVMEDGYLSPKVGTQRRREVPI